MIKAKVKESNREKVPSGTHIARCYSMIHVGTVTWEYQGEVKETDKVRLAFEIPAEMREFKPGEMEPMVISKEYTLSMHEKANLRKDLESWRGKTFTEAEARDFDILNLIGVSCSLGVIHKESKNGKSYADISSLSGVPKGVKSEKGINEIFILDYNENWDLEKFETLPDFIKDYMKMTPEYEEITTAKGEDLSPDKLKLAEKLGLDNSEDAPF